MIPFNRPSLTGDELRYIAEAVDRQQLAGNGAFTEACQAALERQLSAPRVLLTHSGTAALEMAALLAGLGWGDEVIMPSFTFVSTANAVVLRGARPVFVDIREDTLNLDETLVERAITRHTRAILPVHYAGVAAEMDALLDIAHRHGLCVIEDAAQGYGAAHRGRKLGAMGQFGAISFHETKNVIAGEGGALIINDPALVEASEQVWAKGTDRNRLDRGEVARYTWQTLGSSFAPSEITAAFLWAQLQGSAALTRRRLRQWRRYHAAFARLAASGLVRRPDIPDGCAHNGHLYRLMFPDQAGRDAAITALAAQGVHAPFHYVPLHGSPAGARYGRVAGTMRVTDNAAGRLLRLPLHDQLTEAEQAQIIDAVFAISGRRRKAA